MVWVQSVQEIQMAAYSAGEEPDEYEMFDWRLEGLVSMWLRGNYSDFCPAALSEGHRDFGAVEGWRSLTASENMSPPWANESAVFQLVDREGVLLRTYCPMCVETINITTSYSIVVPLKYNLTKVKAERHAHMDRIRLIDSPPLNWPAMCWE